MSDRLLVLADHLATKRAAKWYFSTVLGEKYQVSSGGTMRCESGVTYNPIELNKLRTADNGTKLSVHNIKKLFKGAVVQ